MVGATPEFCAYTGVVASDDANRAATAISIFMPANVPLRCTAHHGKNKLAVLDFAAKDLPMLAVAFTLIALFASPGPVSPEAPKSAAVQVRPVPNEAVRLNSRFIANLSPSAHAKVQAAGAKLAAAIKQQTMSPAQIQSGARGFAAQSFPGVASSDIDAVCYMVMMEAANDNGADLQQTMNQVQQTTASKQAVRQASNSMSDMNSQQQMSLQMAMDRRDQLLEAISNMMKSVSNTQSSIVQNMK